MWLEKMAVVERVFPSESDNKGRKVELWVNKDGSYTHFSVQLQRLFYYSLCN